MKCRSRNGSSALAVDSCAANKRVAAMIVMNGWERADIPEASIVHNESFCGRVIVAIAEFLPKI